MNETIKTLLGRRSCKEYSDKVIPDDILNKILQCGTYAPNGKGVQSPKIVCVKNKKVRDKLSKLNASILGVDIDPFYGAPIVVVVLADKNVFTHVEDGSLVIGNMLNASYSLGVDSCWIHRAKEMFETEEGKNLLQEWGIDDNYVGIGNCILGYRLNNLRSASLRKDDYITFID